MKAIILSDSPKLSSLATVRIRLKRSSASGKISGLLALGIILLLGVYASPRRFSPSPQPTSLPRPMPTCIRSWIFQSAGFRRRHRGFIAGLESPRIITNDVASLNDLGFYAWDMESYQFLNDTPIAPPSANPSLWRQEQLNNTNGLFMVIQDRIYQVRSYDLATMGFVKTRTGWIVIDPLMSRETARAGLALFRTHVSEAPIVAINRDAQPP